LFGPLQADDDLDEIKWFPIQDINVPGLPQIVPGHRVLLTMLLDWLSAGNHV
jgi:hypothetical protein